MEPDSSLITPDRYYQPCISPPHVLSTMEGHVIIIVILIVPNRINRLFYSLPDTKTQTVEMEDEHLNWKHGLIKMDL